MRLSIGVMAMGHNSLSELGLVFLVMGVKNDVFQAVGHLACLREALMMEHNGLDSSG